jgi:hypothetical protein
MAGPGSTKLELAMRWLNDSSMREFALIASRLAHDAGA